MTQQHEPLLARQQKLKLLIKVFTWCKWPSCKLANVDDLGAVPILRSWGTWICVVDRKAQQQPSLQANPALLVREAIRPIGEVRLTPSNTSSIDVASTRRPPADPKAGTPDTRKFKWPELP